MTRGGEAAWVGPQVVGLWGCGGLWPGTPHWPDYQAFPGPEPWPPRTASSFGRGAPSCRGGELRTPRGRGVWTEPSRVLIPKFRGPGAPPRLEDCFGRTRAAEVGLPGGCRAAVKQRAGGRLGVGCRPGRGAEVPGGDLGGEVAEDPAAGVMGPAKSLCRSWPQRPVPDVLPTF